MNYNLPNNVFKSRYEHKSDKNKVKEPSAIQHQKQAL